MAKIKTLQPVRLGGADIPAGIVVDLDDALLPKWIGRGLVTENIEPEAAEPIKVEEPAAEKKSRKAK